MILSLDEVRVDTVLGAGDAATADGNMDVERIDRAAVLVDGVEHDRCQTAPGSKGNAVAESARIAGRVAGQLVDDIQRRRVTEWIRDSARPFALWHRLPEPGSAQARLHARTFAPLGEIVGRARVVGIGEAAHGQKELNDLRNQVFAYLIAEKGFTAVTFESGVVEARIADRYVLDVDNTSGITLEDVVHSAFTHGMGEYQETVEILQWLKKHNQWAAAAGKPLAHLVGKDLPRDGDTLTTPLREVASYFGVDDGASIENEIEGWRELQAVAAESAKVTNTVLDALEENGYPRRINPDFLDVVTSISYELMPIESRAHLRRSLETVRAQMDEKQEQLVQRWMGSHADATGEVADEEHQWAARMLEVARQLLDNLDSRVEHPCDPNTAPAVAFLDQVYGALGEPPPPFNEGKLAGMTSPDQLQGYFDGRNSRERALSDNVAWACERYGKVINHAHNSHLAHVPLGTVVGGVHIAGTPEGAYLTEALGSGYVVIGSTVDRIVGDDGEPLEVNGVPVTATRDAPDSIEHVYFVESGAPRCGLLDFRGDLPKAARTFLDSEMSYRHQFGMEPVIAGDAFDAMIFLPQTSPAVALPGNTETEEERRPIELLSATDRAPRASATSDPN